MRNGFSFKGKHSSDFGVVMKSRNRPILPEQKTYTFDIPGTDGEYDFTDMNEYGRAMYKKRVFELDLQIAAEGLEELKRMAARIAVWLSGSGELIFDDDSGTVWDARTASSVSFTPEHRGKTASLKVMFSVGIGRASFNAGDDLILQDGITLDSDIPLDMTDVFKFELVSGNNIVRLINIGDFYTKPILRFSAAPGNITITAFGKKIYLENLTTDIIFDNDSCVVTNDAGENLINNFKGDFFEIPGGVSEIDIYTDAACVLSVEYTPKTIFDFDFSNIEWN